MFYSRLTTAVVSAALFTFTQASLLPAKAETASTGPVETQVQSVGWFGFRLINSQTTPSSEAEINRVALLDKIMLEKLVATGRYSIAPVSATIMEDVNKGQDFGACRCEVDFGKKVGADLVAWGTVQKVSNLILNINVYIADVSTGKMVFVKSVDIRGNTDTSWTTGLKWLLRYYLKDVGHQ